MATKPTEAVFLGVEVDGIKYPIGSDDMPDKVLERFWEALLKVHERKKFMVEKEFAG